MKKKRERNERESRAGIVEVSRTNRERARDNILCSSKRPSTLFPVAIELARLRCGLVVKLALWAECRNEWCSTCYFHSYTLIVHNEPGLLIVSTIAPSILLHFIVSYLCAVNVFVLPFYWIRQLIFLRNKLELFHFPIFMMAVPFRSTFFSLLLLL